MAEIGLVARIVRQRGIIHDLQQYVVYVGMRLFYFVKQQHRIRILADRFGKQAALLEADIARRSADEARHGVLFHVFAHVEAQEGHVEDRGQRFSHFGFPDACGTVKEKSSHGSVFAPEPGARTQNGPHHRVDSGILPEQYAF